MLTQFYDPVTREDIPCTFHEIRKGANIVIGVADFVAPNRSMHCYVPVLVLGDTRDKQFAEANWLRAQSLDHAKCLVDQDEVSWINLDTGDRVEIHLPLRASKLCFLCDRPAHFSAGGIASERWIVRCSGDCPTYEISKQAADTLRGKPDRKREALAMVRSVAAENRDRLSVVGMEWWYPALRGTARADE